MCRQVQVTNPKAIVLRVSDDFGEFREFNPLETGLWGDPRLKPREESGSM